MSSDDDFSHLIRFGCLFFSVLLSEFVGQDLLWGTLSVGILTLPNFMRVMRVRDFTGSLSICGVVLKALTPAIL